MMQLEGMSSGPESLNGLISAGTNDSSFMQAVIVAILGWHHSEVIQLQLQPFCMDTCI